MRDIRILSGPTQHVTLRRKAMPFETRIQRQHGSFERESLLRPNVMLFDRDYNKKPRWRIGRE